MRLTLVAALLLLTLTLSPRAARAQQPGAGDAPRPSRTPAADEDDGEVERVSVHVVSVPVSVTDRDGRFVSDLRAEEFEVAEGGRRQAISYFASVEQPFSVLLLIDTSGSTQFRLRDIQDSAVAFVNQLRTQDRVLPVAFDNDAVALLPEWSGDRERVAAAIRATRTGMVPASGEKRVVKGRDGKPVTLISVNTRLFDAVHNAAAVLREVRGRKAMIVFTDGFDNASLTATRKSTLAEAEELDALVYVVRYSRYPNEKERRRSAPDAARPVVTGPHIGAKGTVQVSGSGGGHQQIVGPSPAAVRQPPVVVQRGSAGGSGPRSPYELQVEDYLEQLAEKTGGRYYYADNLERIAESFAAVADELRRMYSIGYSPTPLARPGERREVKIKVRRDRLSVRARRAYVFRPL